ncbi:hypothetical protein [Methylobacterium sp. WL6]|uniref:hypothetical protein n=1 Tax=Methylobacterium sp. WL6 TaxID=2603901 RepID=UPI0011CB4D0C|nr:hypothetical protein [Methylobacterium sp. WL6]TXN73445.1 hypothetical protein FV230_01360 [Methylobacterium sp. WL6]
MQKTIAELVLDQQGKDFAAAFDALNDAATFAERQTKAKDRNVAAEARERRADLGRVLFWFHHTARADGTKAAEWNALKVLAQDFVDRGIMKPEAMNRFSA